MANKTIIVVVHSNNTDYIRRHENGDFTSCNSVLDATLFGNDKRAWEVIEDLRKNYEAAWGDVTYFPLDVDERKLFEQKLKYGK